MAVFGFAMFFRRNDGRSRLAERGPGLADPPRARRLPRAPCCASSPAPCRTWSAWRRPPASSASSASGSATRSTRATGGPGGRALTREQVADVLVDLKRRIQGDFYVIEQDDEKIVLGNRACPFAEKVVGRPALCMMTSNVFGVIAAENLGYAKVVLERDDRPGRPGCRVVVYLKPTAEAPKRPTAGNTSRGEPGRVADAVPAVRRPAARRHAAGRGGGHGAGRQPRRAASGWSCPPPACGGAAGGAGDRTTRGHCPPTCGPAPAAGTWCSAR